MTYDLIYINIFIIFGVSSTLSLPVMVQRWVCNNVLDVLTLKMAIERYFMLAKNTGYQQSQSKNALASAVYN